MSQLTTHVLDTSTGKPARGISTALEQKNSGGWMQVARGFTDSDGRITDLLSASKNLQIGIYRLVFDTQSYFKSQNKKSFYPQVTVEFEISDTSHYHVPLLLNPYGYSTYRGS